MDITIIIIYWPNQNCLFSAQQNVCSLSWLKQNHLSFTCKTITRACKSCHPSCIGATNEQTCYHRQVVGRHIVDCGFYWLFEPELAACCAIECRLLDPVRISVILRPWTQSVDKAKKWIWEMNRHRKGNSSSSSSASRCTIELICMAAPWVAPLVQRDHSRSHWQQCCCCCWFSRLKDNSGGDDGDGGKGSQPAAKWAAGWSSSYVNKLLG